MLIACLFTGKALRLLLTWGNARCITTISSTSIQCMCNHMLELTPCPYPHANYQLGISFCLGLQPLISAYQTLNPLRKGSQV